MRLEWILFVLLLKENGSFYGQYLLFKDVRIYMVLYHLAFHSLSILCSIIIELFFKKVRNDC